jgi:ribosome-associated toxin RatA of RatAB toxin-antitoxin module
MPEISLDMEIRAPLARVWDAVVDVERYPASMHSVRSVRVLAEEGPGVRLSAWSIVLKGSILEWHERDWLDEAARVVSFSQVSGDLERFEGAWRLREHGAGSTHVLLELSFEIGIPLLAEMLDPVAQRSLHENCAEMLLGVEREAIGV